MEPPPAKRSLVAAHPKVGAGLARGGEVARGQRARLLEGITRAVAEKGYAAATVNDVTRAAGVSRATFYELFESKEALFLEAYRHGAEVLLGRIREAARAAGEPAGDWRAGLRAGIGAYLETLAAEPLFARTYLGEIHTAGLAALRERDAVLRRFAATFAGSFARAHAEDPALREPDPDVLLVLAAGLDQLVAERVRAGEVERLPELEPIFIDCAEAVLAGRRDGDPDPTTGG